MRPTRVLRELDDRVLGRDWPTWSWLPALTTLQAAAVIVLAVVVAGFVPRIELGGGWGMDPGNGLIALSLAFAAQSPKRPSKRRRTRAEADDEQPGSTWPSP